MLVSGVTSASFASLNDCSAHCAGVPGGNGWTGPDLHGNAIGQVYWTQGRCMMLIGLEVEGPRVERLSAGAKAIYERSGGTCPD